VRGKLTFDAEGQENGPFHSRRFHVPGVQSGLTIGRGYDMRRRSKTNIRDDLIVAGVDDTIAMLLSQAGGLYGTAAEEFIEENDLEDFEISEDVQRELFDIEYDRQTADTRRLATKADVVRAYGETDWEALNPTIKDVLIDLRFRGDYTPTCRKFLQVHVANNDLVGFSLAIGNREHWPNVPRDRYERRKKYCDQAVA